MPIDKPQPTDDEPQTGEPPTNEPWISRLRDAAIEAEYATGEREETEDEAERHVMVRIARIIGGFAIIGIGIAALPLPGPGWLMIILGLNLLPFAWAERTILLIRRRIPGVPEDGKIPLRTWLIMGTLVGIFTVISIVYGNDIRAWLSQQWGDPDKLFG